MIIKPLPDDPFLSGRGFYVFLTFPGFVNLRLHFQLLFVRIDRRHRSSICRIFGSIRGSISGSMEDKKNET